MPFSACKGRLFRSAREDAIAAEQQPDTPQCQSESYRLAFQDAEFLLRDALRPVRLQLELLKPELIQQEHQIESTVVVFGSARTKDPDTAQTDLDKIERRIAKEGLTDAHGRARAAAQKALEQSRYYAEARKLGALVSQNTHKQKFVVVTGGGPGIMEAANRGATDAGALSIGMNIVLPFEQSPNRYVTPELSFLFHYFAIRKMHLLMRAKSLVAFPGGFGTMDELFETLTLIQTEKIAPIPVLLFGQSYWERIIDFEAFVEAGTISPEDLNIFQFVETAEAAWEIIASANGIAH